MNLSFFQYDLMESNYESLKEPFFSSNSTLFISRFAIITLDIFQYIIELKYKLMIENMCSQKDQCPSDLLPI